MSSSAQRAWEVGQKVVINRATVTTVQKITPTGRVVAADRIFENNGIERKQGMARRSTLEPLTDDIQAEMDLIARKHVARDAAAVAIDKADRWLRTALSSYGARVPEAADVDKAERIAAALKEIMGDG